MAFSALPTVSAGQVIASTWGNQVKDNFDDLITRVSITGEVKAFAGFTIPAGWLEANGQAVSRATFASLHAAINPVQSGSRTNGSAVITGLTDTSYLRVGMKVEGAGIPNNTTIDSIDSGTQVTLSNTATSTGTGNLTFFPFGNGDGSTTFNVPDLSDRFPRGASATNRTGATGGAETHTLTEAELPAHVHPIGDHTHDVDYKQIGASGVDVLVLTLANPDGQVATSQGSGDTGSTGDGNAHSILNPFLSLRFIIKA